MSTCASTPPDQLIAAVRERRFANGLNCPRCDSADVVRWGRFGGRQRYRCRACERCFSDLTNTCFSYIKKLDRWPEYLRCLTQSHTVRRAAAATGVSTSTAFRWRHRILGAASTNSRGKLAALVEFDVASLPYSTKGQSCHDWRDAAGSLTELSEQGARGSVVVVAFDRGGGQQLHHVVTASLRGPQVVELYDEFLPAGCTIMCATGRYGMFGWLLTAGRRLVHVRPFATQPADLYHIRNARGWLARFLSWLDRFHGIATRYADNYLRWRQVLELLGSGPWLRLITPPGRSPPESTTPANSAR